MTEFGILAIVLLTGCKKIIMNDWEHYEVAIDIFSVSFKIPPDQSRDGPGKAEPLRFVTINDNMGVENFQRIFDGFWDYRRNRFVAVNGHVRFRLAVVQLTVPADLDGKDLSNYSEQIYQDSLASQKARNIELAREKMPLFPEPERQEFEFETHNGCHALFEKNDRDVTLVIPLTSKHYVLAQSRMYFEPGNDDLKVQVQLVSQQIIDSIIVRHPNIGGEDSECRRND